MNEHETTSMDRDNRPWRPSEQLNLTQEQTQQRIRTAKAVADYALKKHRRGRDDFTPKTGLFRSVDLNQIDTIALQQILSDHGLSAQLYEHLAVYDGGGAAGEIWQQRIKLVNTAEPQQAQAA